MRDVTAAAGAAAKEIIESLGFEMADVEYAREEGQMCLTFYICREEGVTIDDCEAVSRAVDPLLDEADPTDGAPYCLCVSSWGDRPLKTERDLERNLHKEVEIKLKKSDGSKKKKIVGVLMAYDENALTLSVKEETKIIERNLMEYVRPYIGF